jgi:hypothetical protein
MPVELWRKKWNKSNKTVRRIKGRSEPTTGGFRKAP